MRTSTRVAGVATAGALLGTVASPANATAPTTVTYTQTYTGNCYDAGGNPVPITDVQTRTYKNRLVHGTDVLSDPNGTTVSYRSIYRDHGDESGSYWQGAAILDVELIEGGVYYLLGDATMTFSAGGYSTSFSAHHVVNVCAEAFGYA